LVPIIDPLDGFTQVKTAGHALKDEGHQEGWAQSDGNKQEGPAPLSADKARKAKGRHQHEGVLLTKKGEGFQGPGG
jgi:hypothetical protein